MEPATHTFTIRETTPELGASAGRQLLHWLSWHFTTIEVAIGFRYMSGTAYLEVNVWGLPDEESQNQFFCHVCEVLLKIANQG